MAMKNKKTILISLSVILLICFFGFMQLAEAVCTKVDSPDSGATPVATPFEALISRVYGQLVQPGDVVRGYVDDVDTANGCVFECTVEYEGVVAEAIYNDDPSTTGVKEGAVLDDVIHFWICRDGSEYPLDQTLTMTTPGVSISKSEYFTCTACCTDFYRNEDGDDYGLSGDSECLVSRGGTGNVYTVTVAGDCDDSDQAIYPGTACNDGFACTVNDECQANGTCTGTNIDCSGLTDQCNLGECQEPAGTCVKNPYTDNRACNDGLFCTDGETCQAATGTCGGGTPHDCSAEDDQCNEGKCDDTADACVKDPYTDGRNCDDGLFCNVDETCQLDGTCGGGTLRDCSAEDDQCNEGVCNDDTNACEKDPYTDGRACNDDLFCTDGETCQLDGTCGGGTPHDCSAEDDQCNDGECDDTADACVKQAKADGTSCEVVGGNFCNANDTCLTGVCVEGSVDPCPDQECDETGDVCVECLINDHCNDDNICTDDICDATNTCLNLLNFDNPLYATGQQFGGNSQEVEVLFGLDSDAGSTESDPQPNWSLNNIVRLQLIDPNVDITDPNNIVDPDDLLTEDIRAESSGPPLMWYVMVEIGDLADPNADNYDPELGWDPLDCPVEVDGNPCVYALRSGLGDSGPVLIADMTDTNSYQTVSQEGDPPIQYFTIQLTCPVPVQPVTEPTRKPAAVFPWPGVTRGLGWGLPISAGFPGGLPYPMRSGYASGLSIPSFPGTFSGFTYPGSAIPTWTSYPAVTSYLPRFPVTFPTLGIFSPVGRYGWPQNYWSGYNRPFTYQTGWFYTYR